MFSQRRFDPDEPELMDRPQPVSRELERDLGNLRQLNRHFGSHRLIRRHLRPLLGRPTLTVLDLATGSGDIPRLIVDLSRRHGVSVQVKALDFRSATLAIARRLSEGYTEIAWKQADLLDYDYDERFDLVLCSLALHHFSEPQAVAVMRGMAKAAARSVLAADLRRCALTTVGVDILTRTLYREPMTRHDAMASAARAFSFHELAALARAAGWRNFKHRRCRYGRQTISMEVDDGASGAR